MVRLKVINLRTAIGNITAFQFQNGAIKSSIDISLVLFLVKNVSIPK